jgi:hypothetical protein
MRHAARGQRGQGRGPYLPERSWARSPKAMTPQYRQALSYGPLGPGREGGLCGKRELRVRAARGIGERRKPPRPVRARERACSRRRTRAHTLSRTRVGAGQREAARPYSTYAWSCCCCCAVGGSVTLCLPAMAAS